MWRRWKAGQSLHEIGRAFGKAHVSIQVCVAHVAGLLRPCAAALAASAHAGGAGRHFTRDRFRLVDSRDSQRSERAVSTVSREVARHGGRPAYRATDADGQAWESALRPKRCLLAINREAAEISLRVN